MQDKNGKEIIKKKKEKDASIVHRRLGIEVL